MNWNLVCRGWLFRRKWLKKKTRVSIILKCGMKKCRTNPQSIPVSITRRSGKHCFQNVLRMWITLCTLPIYWGHRGYIFLGADALGQESIPDLPSEHRRVLTLIICNRIYDVGSCHFRLWTSYHASLKTTRLVIPGIKNQSNWVNIKESHKSKRKLHNPF